MKNKIIKTTLKIICPLVFWLAVWEGATYLISEDLALFLPSPFSVIKALFVLLPENDFWISTGTTLLRILIGFISGSVLGIILGILTSEIKTADILISPVLKIIRAVPVVSFIILAFLFIEVDNLPAFISMLMVVPLVWQSVNDGLSSTDSKLIEMAKAYKINRFNTLIKIKIPSCLDQIISSLISAIGLAWKSGIAAEVICTPEISIGKSIYRSKADLSYDKVYALTLTVVILSLIFEFLLKYLWKKYKSKEDKTNA